jgi:dienelactone hydrolase
VKPVFTELFLFALYLTACSPQKYDTQGESASPQTHALVSPSASPYKPLSRSITPTTTQQLSTAIVAYTPTITPSPTPEVKNELITFTTQDNNTLAGTLFGDGEPIVILAHMGMPGVDQQSWQPFAQSLAARGYTVLTFDFRGRGNSAGLLEYNKLPYDMDAAIRFLNERGYYHIVCIGASMGGTACMRAALDHELVGLGVIAGVLSTGKPNEVSTNEIQQLDLPKLIVHGLYDFPTVLMDMKKISEIAPEPKMVQTYQTHAHGTDIFDTEYGSHFTELLINFLEAIRSSSPLPTP